MKSTLFKISLFAVLAAGFTSCTEDMEYKDTKVSAINQLYEPVDSKSVTLQASATASLYFEWEAAKAEDSGAPLYEVVFDKEDGDFSNPLYKVLSDENGMRNYATISHKTLNKVGAAVGLESGETGTVKWTVVSSRGLNSAMCTSSKKLTITRLVGFAELPIQLFLTGAATEGGEELTKAVACSSPESGSFEIFTKLKAGESFHMVDKNSDGGVSYSIKGSKIVEGNEGFTVEKDGIYRIQLDFSVASVVMKEIKNIGLWFCPSNKVIFDLPYVGNGVFSGQGKVEFKQEGWGRDQRYKFLMEYADGNKQYWGTKNGTDSNPGAIKDDDPYFYIKETGDNQWDDKWKFNDEFDGAEEGHNPGAITKVSVIFNGANYTHKVELVK